MTILTGFTSTAPQSTPLPATVVVDADNGLHLVALTPTTAVVRLGGTLIEDTTIVSQGFFLRWSGLSNRQIDFINALPISGFEFLNTGLAQFSIGEDGGFFTISNGSRTPRFQFNPIDGNMGFGDSVPVIAPTIAVNVSASNGVKNIGYNIQGAIDATFAAFRSQNTSVGSAARTGVLLLNDSSQTTALEITSSTNTTAASSTILRAAGNQVTMYFHHANPAGIFIWAIGNNLTNERARLTPVGLGIGVTPTAVLHLSAGVAAANGAPFKYNAGVSVQTVVENGAKNFDGTNEFLTAGGVNYTMAKCLTATAALDFPNTLTLTSSDLTIALTGAALGDCVVLGVPNAAVNANSCYTAFVSAANTITVRFNNYSALPIDPASGTFRVTVIKF